MAGAHGQQRRRRCRRPPAAQVPPFSCFLDLTGPVLLGISWPVPLAYCPLCLWPLPCSNERRTCLSARIAILNTIALSMGVNMLQRLRDGAAQVHRQSGCQRGGVAHPGAAGGAARCLAGPGRSPGAPEMKTLLCMFCCTTYGKGYQCAGKCRRSAGRVAPRNALRVTQRTHGSGVYRKCVQVGCPW